MAYSKKRTGTKRPIKKVYKKKSYKKNTNKNLVSLIKKVTLKQSETKYTHSNIENYQLMHNSALVQNNLLYTTQGIGDTGTGANSFNCRVGDEVIGRGIQLKFWIANKLDRPNIMYRLIIFKYQSLSTPVMSTLFKGANGNKIMDDIEKETISPVFQKIFNLQVGYSAAATATSGDTDGREAHKYISQWIPLKNKRIHYADAGTVPKFLNYGFALLPYDSFGTLITDNIASVSYGYKFYFKDP